MDNTIIWVCVIVFVVVLLVAMWMKSDKEGFYSYNSYFKRYCPSASWRDKNSCSKCLNAGWCITKGGVGSCVPGDSMGPYFAEDCDYWTYGSPYYYYPYADLYPVLSVKKYNPMWKGKRTRPYKWIKSTDN